jgi:hypothetical protein
VIDSLSPTAHPNTVPISPTIAVTPPIIQSEITKLALPFAYSWGGTSANKTYQPTEQK